jgi:hypothetical protein
VWTLDAANGPACILTGPNADQPVCGPARMRTGPYSDRHTVCGPAGVRTGPDRPGSYADRPVRASMRAGHDHSGIGRISERVPKQARLLDSTRVDSSAARAARSESSPASQYLAVYEQRDRTEPILTIYDWRLLVFSVTRCEVNAPASNPIVNQWFNRFKFKHGVGAGLAFGPVRPSFPPVRRAVSQPSLAQEQKVTSTHIFSGLQQ